MQGQGDLLPFPSSPPPPPQGVNYSCGHCGYELNLNSSNRNTSLIGSEYSKSLNKGIVSFFSIDESRFTKTEELRFVPYLFVSTRSWGLFRRRTTLNCRNCGNHIGRVKRWSKKNEKQTMGWDGISGEESYDIRIRALQPSNCDQTHNLYMIA